MRRIDESRTYSNFGPLEQEFTGRIAERLGVPIGAVLACANGTLALFAAAVAARRYWCRSGTLCLCPSYTFVATAGAILASRFQCHLVDVEKESWALGPAGLLDHPQLNQAGLIMPVAPYGRAGPLDQWQEFFDQSRVPVVIDGAACLDGLMSHSATLPRSLPIAISLHATKSLSSGEGGLILCRDEAFITCAKQAINHGYLRSRNAELQGLNGKLSEYHAAVGLAELDNLDSKMNLWRAVAISYRNAAARHSDTMRGRLWIAPDVSACYAIYEAATQQDAQDAQRSLMQQGIETRYWYGQGIAEHSGYNDVNRDALPNSSDIAQRLLGLPCFPNLGENVIGLIVASLK